MCGGGGKPPAAYTPQWQSGADSTLSGNLASQSSDASSISGFALPQLQQQTTNLINDPNAASAMSTANSSSAMGEAAGQQQMGVGQGLYGLASSLSPMASQIYQTAFDPQGQLYQQQYQQSQDAQNAMAAMYGVSSGPYGANLAAQNANNFNLQWGNNQLGRETQGASAISGLDALGGSLDQTGAGLQSQGLNTYQTAGMLPYVTSQGIYGNNLSALGSYAGAAGSAMQPGASVDSGLSSYLGLGQSATQLNQQRQQMMYQQQAATMSGIGSLAGMALAPFTGGMSMGMGSLFGGGVGNGASAGGAMSMDPMTGLMG
jgi:hypothetical protein